MLDLSVPLGDLPYRGAVLGDQRGRVAADDTEVAEYVRTLEEAKDTADLPEASGEAIALEFERYLRRHERRGGEDGPVAGSGERPPRRVIPNSDAAKRRPAAPGRTPRPTHRRPSMRAAAAHAQACR